MNSNMMYKNAELTLQEMATVFNPKSGKDTIEVDYATWLVGILDERTGVLYMRQISANNLLDEDEVLKVNITHCEKVTSSHNGFLSYTFRTPADHLPDECYELKRVLFEELTDDIQDAIYGALEKLETLCPRMAS
ncbi:MAG: hypothetical protein IKJ32_04795 [Clostridia bacterium]|nr:hypothetical protein [Clostridia bacterium]